MVVNNISELSPLDLIEKSVKYFAFIIGILYVCGIIITNLYLGRFGISNISPVRIQYILVGFDFIMFLFLPGLVIGSLFITKIMKKSVGKDKKSKIFSFIRNLTFIALAINLLIFVQTLLIYALIPSPRIYLKTMLKIYSFVPWLMGLFVFYMSLFTLFKFRNMNKTEHLKIWFFPNIAIFFFSIVFLVNGYSLLIHPMVHPAFAGGKPINGDILISEEGISMLSSLKMELDENKYLRDVKIIYETSSWLYFIPQKENEEKKGCIALPRKHIDAIRYLSEDTEKKSENNEVNEHEQLKLDNNQKKD